MNDQEVSEQPLPARAVVARTGVPGSEPDQDDRRGPEPSAGLLRGTVAWASTLPADIQPRALLHKFPRIANLIAAMWGDANSLRRYIDDLVSDKRGGSRQGFPVDVLRELFELRSHFDELHPENSLSWNVTGHHYS